MRIGQNWATGTELGSLTGEGGCHQEEKDEDRDGSAGRDGRLVAVNRGRHGGGWGVPGNDRSADGKRVTEQSSQSTVGACPEKTKIKMSEVR